MIVEVVSMQAAMAGRDRITWRGDVPIELPDGDIDRDELARFHDELFRFFNRVDDEDIGKLARIGYELPSLSVGDLINYDRCTVRVAGMGWEVITGNGDYAMALAMYAMRGVIESTE